MRSTIAIPERAIPAGAEGSAPSALRSKLPWLLAALASGTLALGTIRAAEANEQAARSCGVVTAAHWTAGSTAGRTWVVFTNLAACDTALRLVPDLTGKGVVDMAEIETFRCTAQAVRGGRVLSGICYAVGQPDAYFAWGARAPGYDHPTACDRCTGVPNGLAATPAGTSAVGRP